MSMYYEHDGMIVRHVRDEDEAQIMRWYVEERDWMNAAEKAMCRKIEERSVSGLEGAVRHFVRKSVRHPNDVSKYEVVFEDAQRGLIGNAHGGYCDGACYFRIYVPGRPADVRRAHVAFLKYLIDREERQIYCSIWDGDTCDEALLRELGFADCEVPAEDNTVAGEYFRTITLKLDVEKFMAL